MHSSRISLGFSLLGPYLWPLVVFSELRIFHTKKQKKGNRCGRWREKPIPTSMAFQRTVTNNSAGRIILCRVMESSSRPSIHKKQTGREQGSACRFCTSLFVNTQTGQRAREECAVKETTGGPSASAPVDPEAISYRTMSVRRKSVPPTEKSIQQGGARVRVRVRRCGFTRVG